MEKKGIIRYRHNCPTGAHTPSRDETLSTSQKWQGKGLASTRPEQGRHLRGKAAPGPAGRAGVTFRKSSHQPRCWSIREGGHTGEKLAEKNQACLLQLPRLQGASRRHPWGSRAAGATGLVVTAGAQLGVLGTLAWVSPSLPTLRTCEGSCHGVPQSRQRK